MFLTHVVRQFYPGVGGLENHVLDLAAAQVAEGHRVRVVALNRLFKDAQAKVLPAQETLNGIEIVRIPFRGSSRYPIALSVLQHIKDADIVHVHAIDFFFDFLAWTKPFHRRPLVATTHGGFFHTSYAAGLKRLWFATLTRWSARAYDAIIACSASDYDRFRTLNLERLVLIEDGVNTDKFRDAASKNFRKSILWIGRFSQNKRIDRFVQFAKSLRQIDPEWTFTIVGRPDDLQTSDIAALADAAQVEDAIQVVTSPSDAQLRKLMGDCSFIASTSDYEGFGMTAVEGLSAGLFPLLSDIPPYRRLVQATGLGLILDYADPDAAARAASAEAKTLVSSIGRRRRASMEAAAGYDWAHISRKTSELYEQVLNGDVTGEDPEDRNASESLDNGGVSIAKH
ncbi:glycosyltransferase family 4 protein [Methyloceanibacter caenitepidi]|uniref:Xanthan biosynthesis glycosyltransferase GumH n=1 Tax=Methyloceanibacter caenitepidi TaxID=1384459 RepID=A0A0A8JZ23_9HYPH|nr:glycosyltransferase family 4 protein [Methyloceanibacter caenitepidi]BAQ15671.1 xanthan biosynthesis glycosyltransferase GumH [Methyloceanibacter caenitepidi]